MLVVVMVVVVVVEVAVMMVVYGQWVARLSEQFNRLTLSQGIVTRNLQVAASEMQPATFNLLVETSHPFALHSSYATPG